MVNGTTVNPILLLAVPLAVAFLLPLFGKLGKSVTTSVQLLTILWTAFVSATWLLGSNHETINIVTGGFNAPIGINLNYGLAEAVLCLLASLSALGAMFFLNAREDAETSGRSALLQLLIILYFLMA